MRLESELTRFDLTIEAAINLQRRSASLVREIPLSADVRMIAGFDVSTKNAARAAAVVIGLDAHEVIDQAVANLPLDFPYIPGLLSFREAPAVIAAYNALSVKPDVLMLDGQGLLHPRRFGIACHVGVALGKPSIGVAKSPLIGKGIEPGLDKGNYSLIESGGKVLGAVVRTRSGVKPVYVSIGHLCTLEDAINLTLQLTERYRLPDPTRLAHILAGKASSGEQT